MGHYDDCYEEDYREKRRKDREYYIVNLIKFIDTNHDNENNQNLKYLYDMMIHQEDMENLFKALKLINKL